MLKHLNTENISGKFERCKSDSAVIPQLLKEATESRRKCELMKEQETQLKQQVKQTLQCPLFVDVFTIPLLFH